MNVNTTKDLHCLRAIFENNYFELAGAFRQVQLKKQFKYHKLCKIILNIIA